MVDLSRYKTFEAADDVLLRESVGGPALKVGNRRCMRSHADDHDPIESRIGFAIAAAVEAMTTTGLARCGRDWADATHLGESCFGTDSVGVVAGDYEEFGRGVESDTEPFEHFWGGRLGEDLQVAAVDLDLFVKIKPSPSQMR